MALSTTAPIKRALVQKLRASSPLRTAAKGGIHEGFATQRDPYPLIVYQLISAPYYYPWGTAMLLTEFDVRTYSYDGVEANNLDALVTQVLDDASLAVDGQSTLICRRTEDLSSQSLDDEGKKVYMVGGSYEIWTDQSH